MVIPSKNVAPKLRANPGSMKTWIASTFIAEVNVSVKAGVGVFRSNSLGVAMGGGLVACAAETPTVSINEASATAKTVFDFRVILFNAISTPEETFTGLPRFRLMNAVRTVRLSDSSAVANVQTI